MISSLPKLRSDLIVRRQETANGTVFILKNPVTGDFFRFREAEQFIAQQFDGETTLEVVRQRTEEEFGAALRPEILRAFVKNLEKRRLLEREGEKRKADSRRGRIQGTLLYFRVKLLDPSRLFDRLMPRIGFFFTPHFLVLSAALIILAAGTVIANFGQLAQDLADGFQVSSLPLWVVLIFLVISLHEFAHGLTCRHFGGEVHEVGFLMIYLQPALFCNVSDAWFFPEKSKRLWVGFAGPYFELFLWALAALTWRLTDQLTWINFMALIVTTSSGFKTLLNFNPFLK